MRINQGNNTNERFLLMRALEGHAGDISSRLSRGIAVGRAPVVDVRNSHASYVATWYAVRPLHFVFI